MQTSTIQFILRTSSFLIAAIILYCIATINNPTVFFDGVTIPIGNDSFYHLKRIVETVNTYPSISDFDPDIYAPEGTWLTWPKGFDFLMATIAKFFLDDYSRESVARLISSIPPYIGLLNLFLLYIILRLITDSVWIHILTLITYALSPLTQILHSVGIVDHHSFEHIFVLLSFIGVLLWYKKPDSMIGPIFSGIVMGVSQIFHNGLFILQLPLLLTMTISYLKNEEYILKGIASYSISLLISTLLVSSSSAYLYNGMVGFYYLGWFHIYIAALTSSYLLLLARFYACPRISLSGNKKKALLLVAIIMTLLALPLANIFIEGLIYMKMGFPELHGIEENKNIFGFIDAGRFSFDYSMKLYSGFPVIIPMVMIFNIFQCIRGRGYITAWGSYSIIFIMFLNAQFRFHQYGFIFLFISTFMMFGSINYKSSKTAVMACYYLILTFLILYMQYPAYKHATSRSYIGGVSTFENVFSGLIDIANACEKEPGIILSDRDIGHYISYYVDYTDCRVFSNNFNQTPFQWGKTRQTERFLRMSLENFKKENKFIKYIFVTRNREEPLIKKGVIDGSIKKEEVTGPWLRQLRNRILYAPPEDEYLTLLSSGESIEGSVFIGRHPFYRIYKVYLPI